MSARSAVAVDLVESKAVGARRRVKREGQHRAAADCDDFTGVAVARWTKRPVGENACYVTGAFGAKQVDIVDGRCETVSQISQSAQNSVRG